jgi:hydrogenase maturation protein HypF
MLPYTPLHHLLLHELAEPIVLTSGNVSDEPIAYDDLEAWQRLTPIADAFLDHDRPIHTRTDDSVARVVDGRARVVRRSRGYAPTPLTLPIASLRPLLACGAELKNTFCVAQDAVAFVPHHIGDLENAETLTAFLTGIEHYERLFAIEPDVVVHDLHPEYLSTKYALERDGVAHLGVQHHHAHVAACLAEHGSADPVIGVAFDGLGFGDDGTFWGGEILVADLVGSRRVGHFAPVAMPGGTAAIREPWRMAAAYLAAARDTEGLEALRGRHGRRLDDVLALVARDVRSPAASSVGRLFDAVAAIAGLRDVVTYEGQAAIELEQAVDDDERGTYAVPIVSGAPFVIDGVALVAAAAADLRAGVPTPVVAARLHHALADVVVDAAVRVRSATHLQRVALSGGVFQNVHLLERAGAALSARDFDVLTHERVPANDGGISFGQAAVAAARDAAGLIPAADTGHP